MSENEHLMIKITKYHTGLGLNRFVVHQPYANTLQSSFQKKVYNPSYWTHLQLREQATTILFTITIQLDINVYRKQCYTFNIIYLNIYFDIVDWIFRYLYLTTVYRVLVTVGNCSVL